MVELALLIMVANMGMEFILLCILKPRLRLLMLGNKMAMTTLWALLLIANLFLHGINMVGPTASFLGAIAMYPLSHYVLPWWFGKLFYVDERLQYVNGVLRYWANELMDDDEYTAYINRIGKSSHRTAYEAAEYKHYLDMQIPTKQSFQ